MTEFDIHKNTLAELLKTNVHYELAVKRYYERISELEQKQSEYQALLRFGYPVGNSVENEIYTPLSDEEFKLIKSLCDDSKRELDSLKEKDFDKKLFSIEEYHEKSRQNIDRRTIATSNFTFTADQQKTILAIYLEKCFDDKGYLLPEHLGSGIQLAFFLSDYNDEMKHTKTFISRESGFGNLYYSIRKIREWIPSKNLSRYDFGDTADKPEIYDKEYEFFSAHEKVFFFNPLIEHTYKVIQKINDSPRSILPELYSSLDKNLGIGVPATKEFREYYNIIAEYWAILSEPDIMEDISQCSRNQIYRIVYDICKDSDGRIHFSYKLADRIFNLFKLKADCIVWEIYISCYYINTGETNSLVKFIEAASAEKIKIIEIEREKEREREREREINRHRNREKEL